MLCKVSPFRASNRNAYKLDVKCVCTKASIIGNANRTTEREIQRKGERARGKERTRESKKIYTSDSIDRINELFEKYVKSKLINF